MLLRSLGSTQPSEDFSFESARCVKILMLLLRLRSMRSHTPVPSQRIQLSNHLWNLEEYEANQPRGAKHGDGDCVPKIPGESVDVDPHPHRIQVSRLQLELDVTAPAIAKSKISDIWAFAQVSS
jgi:hypothetical protein